MMKRNIDLAWRILFAFNAARNVFNTFIIVFLFYVGFYNIGHRIQILATLLHRMRDQVNGLYAVSEKRIVDDFQFYRRSLLFDLKRVRRLYAHLWRATVALGSAFSLILLIDLTMIFVVTIMFSYLIVESYTAPKPIWYQVRWPMATRLALNWTMLFFILTAANTALQQVRTNRPSKSAHQTYVPL